MGERKRWSCGQGLELVQGRRARQYLRLDAPFDPCEPCDASGENAAAPRGKLRTTLMSSSAEGKGKEHVRVRGHACHVVPRSFQERQGEVKSRSFLSWMILRRTCSSRIWF